MKLTKEHLETDFKAPKSFIKIKSPKVLKTKWALEWIPFPIDRE